MFRIVASVVLVVLALSGRPSIQAQSVAPAQFEVVSIKRNTSEPGAGGGIRSLPDGTMIMTNQPIWSIIAGASPVPTRQVVGFPDWVQSERYDVTTKPPAGSTREQRPEMVRNMFADRMKLVGHVEEREQTTYALVMARSDGRLGPQLKPSRLDCNAPPPTAGSAPEAPQAPAAPTDMQNRCGMAMGPGTIVSGGVAMDQLALSLRGFAGGLVNNRTGLAGRYALTLRFALPRGGGAPPDASSIDDAPEIFTALREQLGLKLEPEKTMVPVFVIDHIERPTEN